MDWILHLDTDELIHPAGAREYSLRQLLLDVPGSVDMVIFPNYVSEIVEFLYILFSLQSRCLLLDNLTNDGICNF